MSTIAFPTGTTVTPLDDDKLLLADQSDSWEAKDLLLSDLVTYIREDGGDIVMLDEDWVGLAVDKGRIEFHDEATDIVAVLDSVLCVGHNSPIILSSNFEIIEGSDSARIALNTFDTNNASRTQLAFRKSNTTTVETLTETADTHYLGSLQWYGVDSGSSWSEEAAAIDVVQDGAAGASYVPVNMIFKTTSASGINSNQLVLHNAGEVIVGASSITITNSIFEVHQNSDALGFYLDGSDAYLKWTDGNLYLMTDEGTNTQTNIIIKGKGAGAAALYIWDGSDTNNYTALKQLDQIFSLDFGSNVTEFVINDLGGDFNFRIESNNKENMFVVDAGDDCVGIGTATFDGTAVGCLALADATEPGAHTDGQIYVYSVQSSDSDSTLGLYTEQAVEVIGTFTASHKLKIKINGTEYWIQLDAV